MYPGNTAKTFSQSPLDSTRKDPAKQFRSANERGGIEFSELMDVP